MTEGHIKSFPALGFHPDANLIEFPHDIGKTMVYLREQMVGGTGIEPVTSAV